MKQLRYENWRNEVLKQLDYNPPESLLRRAYVKGFDYDFVVLYFMKGDKNE